MPISNKRFVNKNGEPARSPSSNNSLEIIHTLFSTVATYVEIEVRYL